jgi:gliding motility-associated-like protein
MNKILLALFLFLLSFKADCQESSKGTEFWFAFIENITLAYNGSPKFSLIISCDVNTTGTITLPALGFSQAFNATGGKTNEVFLPEGIFYPEGSENTTNYGIQVTASSPIQLWVLHHRVYQSDASIVLPKKALNDSYIVMAKSDDSNSGGKSEFIVVSTEDNTTIDIVPSVLTTGLKSPNKLFSVMLNKGQTYQVQSPSDLTGTSIKARENKPIAVFSGITYGTVSCNASNHIYDQNQPVSSWGNHYALIPFKSGNDLFRILAKNNGTEIFQDCKSLVKLDQGQYFDLFISSPQLLISSKPITVGQFKLGQACSTLGDASFLIQVPLTKYSKKVIFSPLQTAIKNAEQFTENFVTIIVPTVNKSLVKLDNSFLSFNPMPTNPEYSFTQASLALGSHTIISDSGFSAFAYGFGNYDSYTVHLGFDGAKAFETKVTISGPSKLCSEKEGIFKGAAAFTASSWNWNFDDEGSSSKQISTHNFLIPGTLHLSLMAKDSANCPHVAEHKILITECIDSSLDCEIFVPTAFSPNEDMVNEKACALATCVKELDFSIYNRWGERVFHTNDQHECWDGTFNGEKLTNAVFAWVVKAKYNSNKEVLKKGNISIIR